MEGLISVVVPVYNVEKYLDRCVKSIISQTYKNIEVILVDDGATDSSGIICDRWAMTDTRVRVVHKVNGGLSDARNAGMDIATGQFICFFDSDDWVELDILNKAYSAIEEADIAVWGFQKEFVNPDEVVENSITIVPQDCRMQKHDSNCSRLLDSNMMALVGYAWNKLYRLDYIRKHYFRFAKGISLVEDILFNSPVLSNSSSVRFLSEVGNHYIQRPRVTLGSKFYPDYFDLKLSACHAREEILRNYGIDDEAISVFMSAEYFASLKSSCRMACSSLTGAESLAYMKNVCSIQEGRRIIKVYHARGKDILIKFALLTKQYWLFHRLYGRKCDV